jgi:hypothetical protein
VADFTLDWIDELESGDTISESEWINVEAGISIDSRPDTHTARTTTVWIGGGTLGQVYSLTNQITTAGGRVYEETVELRIPIPAVIPGFSGCVWPLDPACLTDSWNTYDEATQLRAASLASATLTRLTAGRVGDCPVRLRPAPQNGCAAISWPYVAGSVVGPAYGGFAFSLWRGRTHPRELELPGPIYSVEEVKVDGVVVPEADYEVHNRTLLVYTGDDYDGWPAWQDLYLPTTEVGTFEVTYLNTAPVDSVGAYAAGVLALEFAKACAGGPNAKCRLPGNVTTMVRAGLAIDMVVGSFPDGLTSIREVDSYTALWARNGRAPATLIDPGAPEHRVVTG